MLEVVFEAKVECVPEKWSYVGVEMYVIATPVPLSGSEKVFHELSDVGRGDLVKLRVTMRSSRGFQCPLAAASAMKIPISRKVHLVLSVV